MSLGRHAASGREMSGSVSLVFVSRQAVAVFKPGGHNGTTHLSQQKTVLDSEVPFLTSCFICLSKTHCSVGVKGAVRLHEPTAPHFPQHETAASPHATAVAFFWQGAGAANRRPTSQPEPPRQTETHSAEHAGRPAGTWHQHWPLCVTLLAPPGGPNPGKASSTLRAVAACRLLAAARPNRRPACAAAAAQPSTQCSARAGLTSRSGRLGSHRLSSGRSR